MRKERKKRRGGRERGEAITFTHDHYPRTAIHSKFQRNEDRVPHAPVYPHVPV